MPGFHDMPGSASALVWSRKWCYNADNFRIEAHTKLRNKTKQKFCSLSSRDQFITTSQFCITMWTKCPGHLFLFNPSTIKSLRTNWIHLHRYCCGRRQNSAIATLMSFGMHVEHRSPLVTIPPDIPKSWRLHFRSGSDIWWRMDELTLPRGLQMSMHRLRSVLWGYCGISGPLR